MGNGITNCYPDEVGKFISITVLSVIAKAQIAARQSAIERKQAEISSWT